MGNQKVQLLIYIRNGGKVWEVILLELQNMAKYTDRCYSRLGEGLPPINFRRADHFPLDRPTHGPLVGDRAPSGRKALAIEDRCVIPVVYPLLEENYM